MRIGIMGGTFNPPHMGHLNAATAAKEKIPLDKLILIPAGIPPHKEMAKNSATVEQRLEMTGLCAEEIGAEISDVEIRREGKSFTVDTLAYFRELYPEDELWLIMGTDMFLTVETWRRAEEILENTCIAAVPRNDGDVEKLRAHSEFLREKYGARTRIIDVAAVTISSSELRPDVEDEKSLGYLPKSVREYIAENKLYCDAEDDAE